MVQSSGLRSVMSRRRRWLGQHLGWTPARPREENRDPSVDKLPRQGGQAPWRLRQNYALDALTLKLGDLDDGVLRFSRADSAPPVAGEPDAVPA